VSPSAVSFEVPHEVVPGRFELVPDESEAEHPAPEGVGFVFGLLLLRACAPDLLGQLAHRHAKLDHAFELSGVEAALALFAFFIEVEAAELDRLSEYSGKRSYPNKFFIRRMPENAGECKPKP